MKKEEGRKVKKVKKEGREEGEEVRKEGGRVETKGRWRGKNRR